MRTLRRRRRRSQWILIARCKRNSPLALSTLTTMLHPIQVPEIPDGATHSRTVREIIHSMRSRRLLPRQTAILRLLCSTASIQAAATVLLIYWASQYCSVLRTDRSTALSTVRALDVVSIYTAARPRKRLLTASLFAMVRPTKEAASTVTTATQPSGGALSRITAPKGST